MKLQHIRKSLDDIKEDDLIILEELKSKIEDLEHSLNIKYTELDKIGIQKDIINNIIAIRDSKIRLMRFFSPIIEIILILLGTLATVLLIESSSGIILLIVCLLFGLSMDTFMIVQREYSKVTTKDDSLIKTFINALCNILSKSEKLSINMQNCLCEEESLNDEIKQIETEMHSHKNTREKLKDEVSFVEGNIHAVDCLINKYKIDEMNNDTTLVHFIENKTRRELKKVIDPTPYC